MAGDEKESLVDDDDLKKKYESIERYREYQQRLRDAALSQSEETLGQLFGREWNMGGFDVNPYSPGLNFPYMEFPNEDNIPLFTNGVINPDMLNQYIITPLEYASDKIEALDGTALLFNKKSALPGKLKLMQYAIDAYGIYNAEDPTKEFAGIAVSTLAGFIPGIGPELSLLLSLTGWDEKIGGYVVDYFREPPILYDPGAIMAPDFAGFTQNFLQSHTSVNMEESLKPYTPAPEEALGDEEAFRSILPPESITVNIAEEASEYFKPKPFGDILNFDPPEQLSAGNVESGEQSLSDYYKSFYRGIFDSPLAIEGAGFMSGPVGEAMQKVIGYADTVINDELIEAAKAGTVPENLIAKGMTGIVAKGLSVAADTYKILSADDKVKASAEVVGEHVGSKAGMAAGAATGAAIGSAIFPVLGTAIGGAIGGAIGYFGGGDLGEKAGGFAVDFFRDPNDYLPNYDPEPLWIGGEPDQSLNMEELFHPYIPPPEQALGDEEAFRSILPPESDQGSQYSEQEVNNQNVTVNIAVEGQGDENGIVNKLVARLSEIFHNKDPYGYGVF